jgi:hypothetical protein
VHRRSELDELTQRHSTRGQVEFFLRARGQSLGAVEEADAAADSAVQNVGVAIPAEWRRADVEREDLPRFLFGPEDIVAVVGRDGLVANVAKYVGDQPVVGFNPFPQSNAGVLTPFDPAHAADVLARVGAGRASVTARTMVEAVSDDGQSVSGLNDIYVGDQGHQSARYALAAPGGEGEEVQSSSGLVAGTGTGATGWLRSLAHDRGLDSLLPGPVDARVAWFVREAWPSPFTGASRTAGALAEGERLALTVHSEVLVVFGDGIESDRIDVGHGQRLEIGVASRRLRLVQP